MTNLESIDILLVEDNPNDAELMIRALKKQNLANRFVVLEDGAEALNFIFCKGKYLQREITQRPRVILLDIKLPKVSGLEVLKAIKEDPRTLQIPVVMVTSSQQDLDIKTAYELGANSYVVKPVDFDAFYTAITNVGLYWLLINQPLQ